MAGTSIESRGLGESMGPALSREGVRLDQRPHALLEEEGIAAGPGDEDGLERLDGSVGAQQGQEQLVGALGREGIQTELGVVGLAPPAMLVLRPVVDQEKKSCGRQALDQAVQERLRFGVDPVEIFEDHEQGLQLALAEQETLDGVEGSLATLRRIERLPLRVLDGHVEERQQRGQGRLERPVQREELAGDLLADLPVGLAVVHLEVGPEEIDDRQIAGRLAVGHGTRLQDEPVLSAVGVGELVDEAGLPDAGFPHDGDELAVAIVREGQRPAELLDLGVSADKPCESPRGGSVEPGPLRARSGERVDLHGVRQALDRDRPSGDDLHVAFGELQSGGGEQDGAGRRHLLHARGQVGRLPDRRVVHVQIRADGADDDLAGVEAHADLDGHPVRAEDSLRVLRDRLLHPESGVAGAHGVVLVGERRAEERHDAVAHDLVDRALVAVDRLHHVLEHWDRGACAPPRDRGRRATPSSP